MDEGGEGAADHLLFLPAEHAFGGRVHRRDHAVEVADQHQVLADRPEPVAVLGIGGLGLLLRLDLGIGADPGGGDATRIGERQGARQVPAIFALGIAKPKLGLVDVTGRHRVFPALACGGIVFGMEQPPPVAA